MIEDASEATEQSLILLVDDNPINLQILYKTLQDSGYRLLIAKNGQSALEIARRAKPLLILLDVMMPDMDGFEVCTQLKADPETAYISVIFLSALGDSQAKVRGFAIGGVDYIAKPFQSDEVAARVRLHARNIEQNNQLRLLLEKSNKKISTLNNSISSLNNRISDLQKFDDRSSNEGGVFISYSHKDKAFVEVLSAQLDSDNINYWRDDKDLFAGDVIDTAISQGIKKSWIFLIVISPQSAESLWVKRELEEAAYHETEGKKVIIPVLIGNHSKKSVPDRLKNKVYIEFSTDNSDEAYHKLKRSITHHISRLRMSNLSDI